MRRAAATMGLATALLGAGCARPVVTASAPVAPPRPLVLLVHGRGHAPADSSMVRGLWAGALRTGSRALTAAPLLEDGDVRMVWYADALDPRSTEGCSSTGQGAALTEAGVLEGLGEFGRGFLGALLDLLPDSSSSPLRVLAGDVMYFSDAGKRCAAERRVTAALARALAEGRPVVVVAHSMGGLVAYRALRSIDLPSTGAGVRRFVTLGTPLAVPVVRELLVGGREELHLPRGVASWINVRDPDDPFAPSLLEAAQGIGELSLAGSGDAERAHDAGRYLRDPRAAAAVLRAWCDAFAAPRWAPAGCADVVDANR